LDVVLPIEIVEPQTILSDDYRIANLVKSTSNKTYGLDT
jgi:hypothetical protein